MIVYRDVLKFGNCRQTQRGYARRGFRENKKKKINKKYVTRRAHTGRGPSFAAGGFRSKFSPLIPAPPPGESSRAFLSVFHLAKRCSSSSRMTCMSLRRTRTGAGRGGGPSFVKFRHAADPAVVIVASGKERVRGGIRPFIWVSGAA